MLTLLLLYLFILQILLLIFEAFQTACFFFVRPDQWSYYQLYFPSAVLLIKQGFTPDEEAE